MIGWEDFKNEACRDRMMNVHTLVSLTLSRYHQNHDLLCWLENKHERERDKKIVKDALRILDALDFSLDHAVLDTYLEQLEQLLAVLKQSEVGVLIYHQVARYFGKNCFFIQFF